MKLEISRHILEKEPVYQMFVKIRPVGVELFLADRQTDLWTDRRTGGHDKANNRFPQFCERA